LIPIGRLGRSPEAEENMAYRVLVILIMFAYIACGGDNKNKMDSSTGSGSDSGGNGDTTTGDSGPTADASIGAQCGGSACGSGQECCLGSGGASMCVAATTCTTVGFQCDGPEDCGTQVCCYGSTGSGSAGTAGSTCKNANQCNTTACHVDTDCTEPGAMKCCTLMNTPYSVCLAQCPP
jgi:hypothetical protein